MKSRATALTAALALLLAAALAACSPPPAPPPADPPPISADDMARQFAFNLRQARENHKDNWYTVSAGPVVKVIGRTAYADTEPYPTELRFTLQDDAWSIRPEETVRAVCQFDRLWLGERKVLLRHCAWPMETAAQADGDEKP